MKSKLNYLIGVSLSRKIKTKWFIVANILIAIVSIGLANIDTIIKSFGGDFDRKPIIYVLDNSSKAYDTFEAQINSIGGILDSSEIQFDIEKVEEADKEKIETEINTNSKKKKDMVVVFDEDEENYLSVKFISKGYIDALDFQLINNAINATKSSIALAESGIDATELAKIYTPAEVERIFLDDSKKSEDEQMEAIMSTVFPIFILPFFMLTIFLVQMIGAEVNDEKTTRGMEIIISNVSPKVHFFAKVLAGNLFVIIQGALLLLYGGVAFFTRTLFGSDSITNGVAGEISEIVKGVLDSGLGENLIYILPLTLILMLLTFLAYSFLAGILASMTTNIEDYQQLQTPIIIISIVGYYLAMMAGMFEGAIFIRAFSYVPLISAILSPSLLVLGQIGIIDILISIVLLIFTNFLLYKYGMKIYKVGILNYSSSKLWKKMISAIKE